MLFSDNSIINDFKDLNNEVEHLIIYDINTDKKLFQISSKSKRNVGSYKALMKFITSKLNSLIAVHILPSNSSFSLTDVLTFNIYKSINLIVVKI